MKVKPRERDLDYLGQLEKLFIQRRLLVLGRKQIIESGWKDIVKSEYLRSMLNNDLQFYFHHII